MSFGHEGISADLTRLAWVTRRMLCQELQEGWTEKERVWTEGSENSTADSNILDVQSRAE